VTLRLQTIVTPLQEATLTDPVDPERIRGALRRYWAARDELRALGILRFDRSLHAEYGEWVAQQRLGLTLATSGVQKTYDATDQDGRTYQVKARTVLSLETPTSFDVREPSLPFDFLLGILLSPDSELLAIIRVPYAAVLEHARINQGTRRLRWSRRLLQEPWVDVLYQPDNPGSPASRPPSSPQP
jgi:hypothetical protein